MAAKKRSSKSRKRAAEAAEVTEPQAVEFNLTDEAVERMLRTGKHAGLLRDYFGQESYRELAELAAEASAGRTRGVDGPKVLLLPGIMGSKIGKRRRFLSLDFDDVYWFDPGDAAAGRLYDLRLPQGSKLEPLGVILFAYLKLKLRLEISGFDVDFRPFDWRKSIDELGSELALELAGMKDHGKGKDVSLVAHSMGGLVARAAIAQGANYKRLVMLGTPNFGSFVPVQAFRAVLPLVRKIGALDLEHKPETLASKVFNTFPGLTQLLPFAEKFPDVDLYDRGEWPTDDLRPSQKLLDQAANVQQQLAPADERFSLIAGVNQETVTGLSKRDGELLYHMSQRGDGTVPLDFALLDGVKTYYVETGHGLMANNGLVGVAVRDLLNRGETDALPTSWNADAVRGGRTLTEEQMAARTEATRSSRMGRAEMRNVLEEVASPDDRGTVPGGAPTMAPGGASIATRAAMTEASSVLSFDRVQVGRSRQHRLEVRFAFGSITEVEARAVALGIFQDVAPGGAANAMDRELGGAITELTRRRMFTGRLGEVFMLPKGRHRISPEVLAFVGMGPFDRFNDEVLQLAAENIVRTFVSTKVEEFATVPIGAGSGRTVERSLRHLLIGFLRGLRDADQDHQFRRVIICETDRARYEELKEELFRLSSTSLCEGVEITFDETTLPAPRPPAAVTRAAAARRDSAYLIIRQEGTGPKMSFSSSLLTASGKATVVTGDTEVVKFKLDQLLDKIRKHKGADFSELGQELAELVLVPEVRELLPTQRQPHLVVVHDAESSRIPWEILAFEGPWYPAREAGMSHLYTAENLSVAKWLEERVEDSLFRVLLVVNPTNDLEGAAAEGTALRELIEATPGAKLDELREGEATRAALRAAFSSGKYDVVHYAGHAAFNERKPERSGLKAADGELTGADLAELSNLPTLVFFNACESARVRSQVQEKTLTRRFNNTVQESVGLAEAFMRAGVANFVGTYWDVSDRAAASFSQAFYSDLLRGKPIVDAVLSGRHAIIDKHKHKDWADYIHYGHPDSVVKRVSS